MHISRCDEDQRRRDDASAWSTEPVDGSPFDGASWAARLVMDPDAAISAKQRAAVVALAELADAEGIVAPTRRGLAAAAGVSTGLGDKVMLRLLATGWAELVRQGIGSRKSIYRLTVPSAADPAELAPMETACVTSSGS
jgi:hypothetical protein